MHWLRKPENSNVTGRSSEDLQEAPEDKALPTEIGVATRTHASKKSKRKTPQK